MYYITKTYDHNLGLSSCFRQPFADSHCRDPHGYPLSFSLKFGALLLDRNNWVIDFGGLKPVKTWLCETFDHRMLLAENDPLLSAFQDLYRIGDFAPIIVLPAVGCEGFAKHVFDFVENWLRDNHSKDMFGRGLHLSRVEVREHGGNSAIYEGDR